jgi:transcriptional regulator with XRE-family HTH domain
MKQPELGIKISEIRNQKGITQKELSESCNIDIRTIQRIEAGEVCPRMSTLKLIASTLSADFSIFNGDINKSESSGVSIVLLIAMVAGIINLVNWFFLMPIIPRHFYAFLGNPIFLFLGVHVFTGVLLYFGFYTLGKQQENIILRIASIIIMVIVPLSVISSIINFSFAENLQQLSIIILGINGFLFGFGLLKARTQYVMLNKITGIIQILISPFFIIPQPMVQLIGIFLAIPFLILLNVILYLEYGDMMK